MTSANFIADGYTQPGYILPVDRLHDALRFRFRPVLAEERSLRAFPLRLGPDHATAAHCYLRRGGGAAGRKTSSIGISPTPARQATSRSRRPTCCVCSLELSAFKLQQIVLGVVASDIDPRWPDEQINRLAEEELAATAGGCSIGEARQQESEKN